MSRKEDQKELNETPCVICEEPSTGVIRTKDTCKKCFSIIQRDNIYRYNHDLEIVDNLIISKKCFECNKLFETEFKEIKPEYCVKCTAVPNHF